MSGMNAITTVVASLIVVVFVTVFMIYVPATLASNWSDIEMNDWPLRCPQPALVRRPSDWPLRRMEPVLMSERGRESAKTVGSDSGSTGSNLEGFPYCVR
ncbi:hypothetical protein H4I96_10728 [Botrytis cinerea]